MVPIAIIGAPLQHDFARRVLRIKKDVLHQRVARLDRQFVCRAEKIMLRNATGETRLMRQTAGERGGISTYPVPGFIASGDCTFRN